jgi:exopolysaccharide biosynthesis polyprenyl glycosylphosphotransferase
MLMRGTESRLSRKPPPRYGLSWVRAAAIGAVVGAAAYGMSEGAEARLGLALLVALLIGWVHRSVAHHVVPYARFLPLMRVVVPIAAPLWTFAILAALHLADLLPLSIGQVAILCAVGGLCAFLAVRGPAEPRRPRLRVGVVGSAATTADLKAELAAQANSPVRLVGHIGVARRAPAGEQSTPALPGDAAREAPIGVLGEIADTVVRHRLDLLLVSSAVPRMSFFDEMEATCSHLDVRVMELSSFYEHTFGHVPLRAINAAWFQWVMHPRYSPKMPPAKRAVDLAISSILAVVAIPVVAVLAALVKLGGGPAFYRQTRIGEGGEPFHMLKLRSMQVAPADSPARWSSADDERVTTIGRFIRRTHLDELPQLINVLRGEMSIVGPRPEQPSFVEALEESVPFYSRRHVVRPGITGWAQVGCGYAGSTEGTLWKLSHDLYYLKHRSVTFDLLILGETLRMFFSRSQFPADFDPMPFVHQVEEPEARPPAVGD